MRLTASARCRPVRSWRTMIVRMSASAAASMMGLTGYPMRNFTPSRLRTSATAAAAFMVHSPRSRSEARDCPASGRESVISYARPVSGAGLRWRAPNTVTRDELKRKVGEAIERPAAEIIEVGETIRRHPELGFKESRTAALVEAKFRRLGLSPRTGLPAHGPPAAPGGAPG